MLIHAKFLLTAHSQPSRRASVDISGHTVTKLRERGSRTRALMHAKGSGGSMDHAQAYYTLKLHSSRGFRR